MKTKSGLAFIFPMLAAVLFLAVSASAAKIESDTLSVQVDESFPRIVQYVYKPTGAVMAGQDEILSEIEINGEIYKPAVLFSQWANRAEYVLTVSELDVVVKVVIQPAGNIVTLSVAEIQERGDSKVYTLGFPSHNLISVKSTDSGAFLAANSVGGGDIFRDITKHGPQGRPDSLSYIIINNDKLAGSVYSNSINDWDRARTRIVKKGDYNVCGVWAGNWIYREIDTEIVELPWAKVVITADANDDGQVDWQDGAIALRGIRPDRFGTAKQISSISHIAINFASVSQWPFLRILDNVKKLSYCIDGFPQMLLIKGYESEGHDSAHPDYGGNFNNKAGGVDDFNYLCRKAKEFNTDIGVHINHTEAYPEARAFSDELVTEKPKWRWLDQSYEIDRKKDILAGNLYKRLEELRKDAPYLSFTYVDVYSGRNWVAWKLGEKLNTLGWWAWTEFHPFLDPYALWTHQPAGKSRVARFVNNDKDTFAFDKLLKGYYRTGFMGWDDGGYERNLPAVVELFFTRNLPTKYMQNHDLLKWTETEAVFAGGLVVRDEAGKVNMYKNGSLIASDKNIFIPWNPVDEVKIYHWNEAGGKSTWKLPASWSGIDEVVVYELTDLGRVMAGKAAIKAGSVTINAKAKTPYVVCKTAALSSPVQWSEGSPVKDMGFDSHGFKFWTKAGSTDGITIKNTSYGQTYLNMDVKAAQEASVSQKISGLEPGKTYSASVWMQIDGVRNAGIRVSGSGITEVSRAVDRTDFTCNFPNIDKNGTRYQRLKVLFDVPAGKTEAVVTLFADKGDEPAVVMFDDVRVRTIGRTAQKGYYFFEDFENVDEGWGPFVYAFNGPCQTHVSELHEGFTDDTVDGRYSFKSMEDNHVGSVVRTLRSTLELKPNTKYTIGFDYITDNADQYRVAVAGPFIDTFKFDKTAIGEISEAAKDKWQAASGRAQFNSFGDGFGVLKSGGESYFVSNSLPQVANGEVSLKIKSVNNGRCGLVVRYAGDRFGFIGYDMKNKWVWSNGASYGTLTNSGPEISDDGKFHTLKVRYVWTYFKVWVDGNLIFEGHLDSIPTAKGKIGFRNWGASETAYGDVALAYTERASQSDTHLPVLSELLGKGKGSFKATFKTKDTLESFIFFEKLTKEKGKLVIDNLYIK